LVLERVLFMLRGFPQRLKTGPAPTGRAEHH